MAGRSLIAVVVAAALTAAVIAFALGRAIASDHSGSSTAAGSPAASAPTPSDASQLTIKNFAFSPDAVTVKMGSSVTWTNDDGFAHSVKSRDGSFVSGDLDQGQTYTTTFATPGTFAYVCGIHSFMTGTVVVKP